METRFIVPVIAATAFHALVFFGFNGSGGDDGDTSPPIKDPPVMKPIPFDRVFDIVEPTPVDADTTDEPKPKRGDTEENPIRLPDNPSSKPGGIEIPFDPTPLRPGPITNRIPTGVPGIPGGVDDGVLGPVVIRAEFLDDPPRTRLQVPPVYPTEAKKIGLDGEVMVEFIVDESGAVTSARVVESSDSIFEAPTLRAVQKWRFEPGRKLGRPVRFRMAAPVVFSLDR